MIVITWMGLTQYGARCVGSFVKHVGDTVRVVQLPAKRFAQGNLESLTGTDIINVNADDSRSVLEIVGEMPEVFVLAGWAAPAFVRWAREVKASGGKVIMATDEAFVDRSFRQFVRKWRYLLKFDSLFDRVFVCGAGGVKQFVDYYGLPSYKVFTGCYASDPSLFFNGPPLKNRDKKFLYVGRFDENKNVLPMCEAFKRVHARHPDWELEICGSGPLVKEVGRLAGIENWTGKTIEHGNGLLLTGFIDNSKLGEKYRSARVFILGSFSDKWGVVVHEAAASGCLLLLSDHVGAHYDFAREENSALFRPDSIDEFEVAMEKLVNMMDSQLVRAQETSVRLAAGFSPYVYGRNLRSAIEELKGVNK